jgi:hypothetical protein
MFDVIGWIVACFAVGLTVSIHYQIMLLASDRILPWTQRRWPGRSAMLACIGSLFCGHVIEIWLYAVIMMILLHLDGFGSLTGAFDGDWHAFIYYSAAAYTAIGNGDVHQQGPIRSVIVSETLTGLMMIAWSASFTYLKMEQIWQSHKKK